MRPLWIIALLLAGSCWADETTERTAIAAVFRSLNDPDAWQSASALSAFFTADADAAEIEALRTVHGAWMASARRPMSELSMPKIDPKSVRFITPDVAYVIAADSQFGSLTISRSVPMVFVMCKQDDRWKIAAVRVEKGPTLTRPTWLVPAG